MSSENKNLFETLKENIFVPHIGYGWTDAFNLIENSKCAFT